MQSCEHLIYLVSRAGVRGGDETYESIARKGEAMTLRMVTCAYDQIDHARTALEQAP